MASRWEMDSQLSSFFPGKFAFLKDLTLPSEKNENETLK